MLSKAQWIIAGDDDRRAVLGRALAERAGRSGMVSPNGLRNIVATPMCTRTGGIFIFFDTALQLFCIKRARPTRS
jgi:hypothetical protein